MWYCIYATDSPNSLKMRLDNRPKHLERLNFLQNKRREIEELLFGGGKFTYILYGSVFAGFQ